MEALAFFFRQDKNIVRLFFTKKKDRANIIISETNATSSSGDGRGVYFKKKIETFPKWRKPLGFFPDKTKKIETSSNYGRIPGEI